MNKQELLEFINGVGAETFNEVKTELGLSKLNKETVENYLKATDDGKSLLFSTVDKEHDRRMKKYKEEGGFAKDFEAEFQKRNPSMTEEQKRIRELELENETFKKNEIRSKNLKELKALNSDFNLPEEIFELLVSDNLEDSKNKISSIGSDYKKAFESALEKAINERLAAGHKPVGTGKETKKEKSRFERIMAGEI